MNLRTPLSRVRGLGSARDGTHHFILQRLSAMALIPLTLWFVASLIFFMLRASHANLVGWIKAPWHAELLILFFLFLFYHAYIGLHEVVVDYVHNPILKMTTVVLMQLIIMTMTTISVLAILRITLGG